MFDYAKHLAFRLPFGTMRRKLAFTPPPKLSRAGPHKTKALGRMRPTGYNVGMNLKAMSRLVRGFKLEVGELRAQGPPAMVLAFGGVVLAAGLVRLLTQNAAVLPETLREAKNLVDSLRGDSRARLPS